MHHIPLYQVDAFTNRAFGGNPAAVCPLEAWLPDALMLAIAGENNLSETAFFVPVGPGRYHLRWFTPVDEVDLCGHATLATSHVVFTRLAPALDEVVFDSKSGPLTVRRAPPGYEMSFPVRALDEVEVPTAVVAALGAGALGASATAVAAAAAEGLVLIQLADAAAVRSLKPDFGALLAAERRCVVVTAAGGGAGVDFVSRFFAPCHGIDEDPVTGSAHCSLVPYWHGQLGKSTFEAHQVSARGGRLRCSLAGDRVLIAGEAVEVLSGVMVVGFEL